MPLLPGSSVEHPNMVKVDAKFHQLAGLNILISYELAAQSRFAGQDSTPLEIRRDFVKVSLLLNLRIRRAAILEIKNDITTNT